MKSTNISRRRFLQGMTGATALATAGVSASPWIGISGGTEIETGAKPRQIKPGAAQKVFPRWRGFNLTHFFTKWSDGKPFEDEFRWMQDWGFDFIRLPMSYETWVEEGDWYKIKESTLEKIDQIVEWAKKHGIHTSLNFHRGPGYCVNPPAEKLSLWKDEEALKAFHWHWAMFAKRYKGVPSKYVSFDLLNEPKRPDDNSMTREDYVRVMTSTTKLIRQIDPSRLVIVDGLSWGRDPVPELVDLGVGQSTRGYDPMPISHYQASWVNGDRWPEPVWPDSEGTTHKWDRKRLEGHYKPWIDLAKKGVGVHCGECGCYNKTPHEVFLKWFRDVLDILTENSIGYSLWNFTGSFGILDSKRADVEYEDFHGHTLDRGLLKLLQEY
ncbi:MAG: cellulase family glycosylhydrolase [Sedimentisphaerales bacterium]|nr:cellulase family glycosylhydrolase [Sedimentisphaerales bacterium]